MNEFIVSVVFVVLMCAILGGVTAYVAYRFKWLQSRPSIWEVETNRRMEKQRNHHKQQISQIRQELVRLGVLPEEPGWIEHFDEREGKLVKDKMSLVGELVFIESLTVKEEDETL